LSASATACTPANFDNVTGGEAAHGPAQAITPHRGDALPTDPTLKSPRPISPISVSWVNTLRPKFRWELRDGVTGAVVELSQSRNFKDPPPRQYVATGTELTVPEDLPAGMWFWRLRGRSDVAEGVSVDTDTVFEVLVRGPSRSGVSSDAPTGSISDLNGDGIPDLSFAARGKFDYADGATVPSDTIVSTVITSLGDANGFYQLGNSASVLWADVSNANATFSAGTDIDGDGYPDLVVGDQYSLPAPGAPTYGDVMVYHGGPNGGDDDKDQKQGWLSAPFFPTVPNLRLVGDVNGDGYGDLSMLLPDSGYAALGGPKGLSQATLLMFPQAPGDQSAPGAPHAWRALSGACDLDGDGLSEIAMASSAPSSPITLASGTRSVFAPLTFLTVGSDFPGPQEASAISAGDFDGNGKAEFAFATTLNGLPAVCFYQNGPLTIDQCWRSDAALPGFGTAMGAADVDADGADDILVTSDKGVAIIKRTAGGFDVSWVLGSFSPSIAVIHPGRPGNARWAVAKADGSQIQVFVGTTPNQPLVPSSIDGLTAVGPSLR
jgi:hypothetical protein